MFPSKKKVQWGWKLSLEDQPQDCRLRDAVKGGDLKTVKQLVSSGVSVNTNDKTWGRPVLSWTKSAEVADFLIKSGASVNATDFLSQTPLHRAVISGAPVDLIKLLLSRGVNPNAKDLTGKYALDCSQNGDVVYDILKNVTKISESEAPVKHQKTPEKTGKEAKNTRGSRPYTITKEVAIEIAKNIPKTSEKVRFVAIDYNWGPPIGHRTDTDFIQLWVVTTNKSKPKEVSLIGVYQNMKNWDVKHQLSFVTRIEDSDYDLYFLNLETSRLPIEFVIKLECQDGSVHYDNNGGYGVNYKLLPYQGRYTSAHAGTDHIQIYPNFVRCQIISRNPGKSK